MSEKQGFITNQIYCNTSPVQNIGMQSVGGGGGWFVQQSVHLTIKLLMTPKTKHYYIKALFPVLCFLLVF